MQFVANGPEIPEALLQAHEEGDLVFFCGAGVSYPAGLPCFKGLVKRIYQEIYETPSDIEQAAFDRNQFDATLDQLERRLPNQRLEVRRALQKTLVPNLRKKGSIDTHESLLRLAQDRNNALRLVTTNYDRVFQAAQRRMKQSFQVYSAPMLPIPKKSRWNGLVYLHGLLPDKEDETALNRLVLTSGDFGLAYLTERWAARFVSEMFRSFAVLFIGYSIDDPVLRYMMDALAADRMLGETTPQAWAMGAYEPGDENIKRIEWQAKGVIPILYNSADNHQLLHQTLNVWARTYRDGVTGKERIVVEHALARPSASTRQDNYVDRMMWALSDKSGLPAKRFAEFNPAPSLDWLLEAFSAECYQHSDLPRFCVTQHNEVDTKLRFSLVNRPAPYKLAPSMKLVSDGDTCSRLDTVMFHLARWLTRYLNDPRLVIWIAQQGGRLHGRWVTLIEYELDQIARIEREGNTEELDRVRANAPSAVPSQLMRVLWRLLLSGRVKSSRSESSLYHWKERFQRDGLTIMLRLELRELLAPKVRITMPSRWGDAFRSTVEPTHLCQLVNCELVLDADHVRSTLVGFSDCIWQKELPSLLEDFQHLLRDALDIQREMGEASDLRDQSYWGLPSISPHWQNRGFHDWVALIELLRDSWLATYNVNKERATRIAQTWNEIPYPTFKRLAFFAASHDESIAPEQWIDWLLADEAWWLWYTGTRREVLRLFVLQGCRLSPANQVRLEAAILAGPLRKLYPESLTSDEWQHFIERYMWLYLAKLKFSGIGLGPTATRRLDDLSSAHPKWRLAEDESDEFSHWMSGTGDPDFDESREIEIVPHKRTEIVHWIKGLPTTRPPNAEDDWCKVCQLHMLNSMCALSDLSNEGVWPVRQWQEALYVWSEKKLAERSWRYAAPLVQSMPGEELLKLAHAVTTWLLEVSKSNKQHEAIMLEMCHRVLDLPFEADSDTEQNDKAPNTHFGAAINHPIGHITQALLNLWFKHELNDNDHLPNNLEPLFSKICDTSVYVYRHGRVLLGANLIALFRVDRAWTEQNLLPLFDWKTNQIEAQALWTGFLLSPRLYSPLLIAQKQHFLDTAHHYNELGELAQHFAAFLTFVALEPIDGLTIEELRSAFGVLPQAGLQEAARALSQALEGAAGQREKYWDNRVKRIWQQVWPKSRALVTPQIAESLSLLCIAAGHGFPEALIAVQGWLQPIDHPYNVLLPLSESGLCRLFPSEALNLLVAIIDKQQWMPQELKKCLDVIAEAKPVIKQENRYQSLELIARTRT